MHNTVKLATKIPTYRVEATADSDSSSCDKMGIGATVEPGALVAFVVFPKVDFTAAPVGAAVVVVMGCVVVGVVVVVLVVAAFVVMVDAAEVILERVGVVV